MSTTIAAESTEVVKKTTTSTTASPEMKVAAG